MKRNFAKRTMLFLLCLAMLAGNLPAAALAVQADGLCTHHTEHADCGYEEGISSCSYVCQQCAAEQLSAGESQETEPVEEQDTLIPEETQIILPQETIPDESQETLPEADAFIELPQVSDPAAQATVSTIVDSGECGNNVYWSLNQKGVLTITGSAPGNMTLYIADSQPWHKYKSSIKSIDIKEGVTSIGIHAFSDCVKATKVNIPSTVKEIGELAFSGCTSLTSVTIPEGVTLIDYNTFGACFNLSSVTLPNSLKTIEVRAFADCINLKNISLPSGLTRLGTSAFSGCSSLTSIILPSGLTEIATQTFFGCSALSSVSIPNTVTRIGDSAFWFCTSLNTITIPSSVKEIGSAAFVMCGGDLPLTIYFKGNAPTITDAVFYESATGAAYYPSGNTTWTTSVCKQFGGLLTWNGQSVNRIPKLSELEPIDYMAFSAIAYFDFVPNRTVLESLTNLGKWDQFWSEGKITYAELCANIAQWKVLAVRNLDRKNGFYAVAFCHPTSNEVMIAYRGSVPLDGITKDTAVDAAWDWLVNDARLQVVNLMKDVTQPKSAFQFYEDVRDLASWSRIDVTGHSLGGGLADLVSARYNCNGVSMNAISTLDVVYNAMPAEMGEKFHGVDAWKFVDHANEYDYVAGMWECNVSKNAVKPIVIHKSNLPESKFLLCHSLATYADKNSSTKEVKLTTERRTFVRTSVFSSMLGDLDRVSLGTTKGDTIKNTGLSTNQTVYGGKGNDTIHTGTGKDRLLGGAGNDTLDGGWDDDFYMYYKGDGLDIIKDTSGDDILYLMNFSDRDTITVSEEKDGDYINVLCNNVPIVKIYKKGRAYLIGNADSFKIAIRSEDGSITHHDITEIFSVFTYVAKMVIACPVNVEILDAEGNVVYTLKDGEEGTYYTEYGNFYVHEEEDGEYSKTLELVEGYTARVVGDDNGTMNIQHQEIVDGQLSEEIKVFEEVPVSTDFVATFEETAEGELVLSADTDGDGAVDAKLGYDGQAVPVESITISHEYVAMNAGDTVQISAAVKPAELAEFISWSVEEGSENIVSVEQDGTITALPTGVGCTGYILATVSSGTSSVTARCRVDVAQTQITQDEETGEEEISTVLEGVQLSTATLTTELYSTNYSGFEILLQLPQNYPATSTYSLRNRNTGVMIESVRFTNPSLEKFFEIQVLDDRSVILIPTDYAIEKAGSVKSSYTDTLTVVAEGKEYVTEKMTLTVKKTKPSLKAKVPTFNSFCAFQSQDIVITGGTPTAIYENPAKNTSKTRAIPKWLTLSGSTLTLTEDAPKKSVSASAYLLVETEEWRIPAAVTVSVKNSYSVRGLKLSKSSVTVTKLANNSSGIPLKLLPTGKNSTLESLNVTAIEAPSGYAIQNFNLQDGSFILKTQEGFPSGTIKLKVHYSDTPMTQTLSLTVKTATVVLKPAKTSVTLNTTLGDSAVIDVSATPADYQITDPVIRLTTSKGVDKTNSGELDIHYSSGQINIAVTETTKGTYKLYIRAGGSKEAVVTIYTASTTPSVTYTASGAMDLTFPENVATIKPTFKNYYTSQFTDFQYSISEYKGKTLMNQDVSNLFALDKTDTGFQIRYLDETAVNTSNTYKVKIRLYLIDGNYTENTISLKVKRSPVKLKLAKSKLTLNKSLSESTGIAVTCATKGYTLDTPTWQLRDSTGKKDRSGKLDIQYADGMLTIGVNDATAYGTTYKLLVKANEYSPATTLSVTIPSSKSSKVTSSLKISGKVDVIRNGSEITVTPSYKNCVADTTRSEELFIYSSADNYQTPVNDLFSITPNENGGYTIKRAEGAALNHTKKYKVRLETTIGDTPVKSALTSITVTMGSPKISMETQSKTLFAKDKNDLVVFWFDINDTTQNELVKVQIKESSYRDMFDLLECGDGIYALAFKDGQVHNSLITEKARKSVSLTLSLYLEGNQTNTANKTFTLKVTVVK